MQLKERLSLGTSCLVVSAGLSAAQGEIEVGHKLPGGVSWAECALKGD